ncbi:MAG: Lrp/AsnC family transcriptional regulator [Cyclobacteriaceae bacterium]
MTSFDKVDLNILALLQENSRYTIKEMAQRLNLSTTPVFERIKRLEKQGIIQKYIAVLDPGKLGKKLRAFVHISLKEHSKKAVDAFVDKVVSYPEVMECYHVTGDSDFLLNVMVEDIERYNHFVVNKLSIVPNIGKLETQFSLSVRKKTQAYHLE